MSKDPSQPVLYSTFLGGQGPSWDGRTGYETPTGNKHAGSSFASPNAGRQPVAVLERTFEFRLAGSETQEQSVPVVGPADGSVVVAVNKVRAYLSSGGDAPAARGAISGFEVWVARREGAVVCCARLSDFAPADLVVVQADVAVLQAP
jgi:hypothetical protein